MSTALFHQAHFLPWPGYLARCVQSDIVVFLNDVKFKKGYYHNRTKIYVNHFSETAWLTIPLNSQTTNKELESVEISVFPLFKKWFRQFRLSYQKSPNFEEIWIFLENSFNAKYPYIDRFNQELIKWTVTQICENLKLPVPIFQESSSFNTVGLDKTERLLLISKKLEIKKILMGKDSYNVHDINLLSENNIECLRHVHCSDTMLSECKSNLPSPISGLTFLHNVLIYGWEYASNQLIQEWEIIQVKREDIILPNNI